MYLARTCATPTPARLGVVEERTPQQGGRQGMQAGQRRGARLCRVLTGGTGAANIANGRTAAADSGIAVLVGPAGRLR
jgi:hypothetical protein